MSEIQYPAGHYHTVDAWRREHFASDVPRDVTLIERRLWHVNPADHSWREKYLHEMPNWLAGYFANRYEQLFNNPHNGRRLANTFLRQTLGQNVLPRLKMVKKKYTLPSSAAHELPFIKQLECLPTLGHLKIRDLAYRVASFLSYSLVEFTAAVSMPADSDETTVTITAYRYLAELAALTGTTPPYWARFHAEDGVLPLRQAQSGLLRMMAPEWWRGRLKRMRDLQREHMAIAVGQVQKSASAYVSRSTLGEWVEQKKRNREFFKRFDLINDEGYRIALEEVVNHSNANPAIRRCELMVRMRGFEDIASETGCVGDFYTITAPSKYHAVHSRGGFVSQWNGASPGDTQRYLCKVWSKIRARLSREDMHVFGFRVVEPHHDGTPHWHMLLFMRPEHLERVREIIRDYAYQEDSDELTTDKARKARFHAEAIDPAKGSATAYIAKYISKNIDGYALDGEIDDETGESLRDMAKAVCAWASRWRIRQFQQIGGAPVTVWRELRRLRDKQLPDPKMDAVLAAADTGCWASYTQAQGGPLVSREDLVIRLCYEITEQGNEYAEDVQRIQGIYSPQIRGSEIPTRLVKWEKVAKAEASAEAGFSGGSAAPWSSVNNCTHAQRHRLTGALQRRGVAGSDRDIAVLMRGGRLLISGRNYLIYRNGRLTERISCTINARYSCDEEQGSLI
ncbi:replication endonuclease [Pantoea sp. FN0307]|uniref:replication endonuclease n=1 Tax=unclassified Pantoea TaxID=2630326 RepID=UPI003CE7BCE4